MAEKISAIDFAGLEAAIDRKIAECAAFRTENERLRSALERIVPVAKLGVDAHDDGLVWIYEIATMALRERSHEG